MVPGLSFKFYKANTSLFIHSGISPLQPPSEIYIELCCRFTRFKNVTVYIIIHLKTKWLVHYMFFSIFCTILLQLTLCSIQLFVYLYCGLFTNHHAEFQWLTARLYIVVRPNSWAVELYCKYYIVAVCTFWLKKNDMS